MFDADEFHFMFQLSSVFNYTEQHKSTHFPLPSNGIFLIQTTDVFDESTLSFTLIHIQTHSPTK